MEKKRETWSEIAERTTRQRFKKLPSVVIVLGTVLLNNAEYSNASSASFDKIIAETR
jgi:hypothetical protein